MASKATVFIGLLLAIAASFFAGRLLGNAEGHAQATQQCLAQQITRQTALLNEIENVTRDAKTASIALHNTIAERQKADEQTTREIRHALKQTANQRIECVLPADVMQQLHAARERANAAATGGVSSAVPGTTGTDG